MNSLVRMTFCFLLLVTSLPAPGAELPVAKPEEVGLRVSDLDAAAKAVQDEVDAGKAAGAVTMVIREGKVIHLKAVGKSDLESSKPMTTDAIFRIYSMTKPITSVAAMMLIEEKKLGLDDPVSKHIPELKGLRVYVSPNDEPVEAKREMSIRDLLRHTSGLSYGLFGDSPVDKIYRDKKIVTRGDTMEKFISKLATAPLVSQPGTKFTYSVSTDVLGRVVEVVSGQNLEEFFSERIFKPLEMVDTSFAVPSAKLDRFTTNYGRGLDGKLHPIDVPATSDFLKQPELLSGGGGLCSTARDYARFCQMLLNEGELQGTRLLQKETVQLMAQNQLPAEALPITMPTLKVSDPGLGFGLGFGVRLAPSALDPTGVPGEYFWGGAASTGFTICPKNRTVVITLTQLMPFTPTLADTFKQKVNAAVAGSSSEK